jgi:NADH-quinone oxidoreductase subunit G
VVFGLVELKGALEKESDVVIVFGSELRGAAIARLVQFGSQLLGRTRFITLGDYANSRGAADMGLLPDFLPGYVPVSDAAGRAAFEKLWGAPLPERPGLTAAEMMQGVAEGRIKALVVVGANPVKTFGLAEQDALRGLPLLLVLDLFLHETAQHADVFLPATCAYEKDGTFTNTAGEVQLLRKALDTMGPRSDFDILRILSHQVAGRGVGKAIALRTPEAALEEIRQNVRGYNVALANLLAGGAEVAATSLPGGATGYDVAAAQVFSSRDTLFTSGTLGRYCSMINSLPEAKAKP